MGGDSVRVGNRLEGLHDAYEDEVDIGKLVELLEQILRKEGP